MPWNHQRTQPLPLRKDETLINFERREKLLILPSVCSSSSSIVVVVVVVVKLYLNTENHQLNKLN